MSEIFPVWERRESQRLPVQVWVEERSEDATYFHRTANLSSGGLFVEGTLPHAPGTRVHLRFALPGNDRPVEVMGEIVQPPKGQETGMAVRFVDLPDAERDRIDAFVRGASGLPFEKE